MKQTYGRYQVTRLVVDGFMSIAHCALKLAPIDILIRTNGKGKSSLILIFHMIHQMPVTTIVPEQINDGHVTPTPKRIQRADPGYNMVLRGQLLAASAELDRSRAMCHHFDAWLQSLLDLAKGVRT